MTSFPDLLLSGWIQEGLSGFLLGVLFLATKRNLAVPIVAHGVSNTVAFALIYAGRYPGVGESCLVRHRDSADRRRVCTTPTSSSAATIAPIHNETERSSTVAGAIASASIPPTSSRCPRGQ